MSPPISKDTILDAAEAIVRESGAARLTLDAVADRADVSKGGLMYSYPTKAALLQGMIRRLIDNVEELRTASRQEFEKSKPTDLMVEIKTLSKLDDMASNGTAALLAAIANEPSLMEPFRDEMRKRMAQMVTNGKHPDRSTILFFAALGVHFSALFGLPVFEPRQRKQLYEDLLQLSADPGKKL